MSDTLVSLLTPPGTGAIATVAVCGPRAWELAKELFTPAGNPLPDAPDADRFWFGTLGADEVVLACVGPDAVEVHCHGGRRVVQWVMEQFLARGCIEDGTPRPSDEGFELLQRAPTLRTASIILDQLNGAFAAEVRRVLALLHTDPRAAAFALHRLAELGSTVGQHLVEPWKVAVAGPPNVGKSSLVNALAGFQRAVVSDVAGTTRDAVSVRTAFDGWPVELTDTAGLRDADGLEAEGIEHAKRVLSEADLVVWVMDGSDSVEVWPDAETQAAVELPLDRWVVVVNKADRGATWPLGHPLEAIHLSALTGENVPRLVEWIAFRLVRNPPAPGTAVPFTPRLVELVAAAAVAEPPEAVRLLREALAVAASHTAGPSG